MRLITQQKLRTVFVNQLNECSNFSFAVAWASAGFDACDALIRHKNKIAQGIVGTHFYQTDPKFIEKFKNNRVVKFIFRDSNLFHPKIYLFEFENRTWSALIGSANFTASAFSNNNECLIYFDHTDDPSGNIRTKVKMKISEYWNFTSASYAGKFDLDDYRYWHSRAKNNLKKAQGEFGDRKAKKSLIESSLLNMDWPTYLTKIRNDRHHSWETRLAVLRQARKLFETHRSFDKMQDHDRKGIAGFVEKGPVPWGYFGSMKGAGKFKGVINQRPADISLALDAIPLSGLVGYDEYREYVSRFTKAFLNGGHGVATATRLLALKRPDQFVCFDRANNKNLCTDFGIVLKKDYEFYWNEIIGRLREAKWWNAKSPKAGLEREAWQGRTALIDALYYEPV